MNYLSSTDFLNGAVTRVLLLFDRPSYILDFPYVSIVSYGETFSPLQNLIHVHLVNSAASKNLKSLLTVKTNHKAVDKVIVWLLIPSQMTNVLNLFCYIAL